MSAYKTAQSSDWYRKIPFFRRYMLRELSCIPIALYTINLLAGMIAFVNGEGAWVDWVIAQRNPIMLLLMACTLFFALLHSSTWFETAPKLIKIYKKDGTPFPPQNILIASWGVFALISVIMICFVMLYR